MENNKISFEELNEVAGLLREHNLLRLKASRLDCEGNRDNAQVFLREKQKYIYINTGNGKSSMCGKWLFDKENKVLWSIKAYGQKNRIIGTIEKINNQLKEDIGTLNRVLNENIKVYNLWWD